jgi:hypothetical protein
MTEQTNPFPVLSRDLRQFPKREREPSLQETDANGDVIFRFRLGQPEAATGSDALTEFYRNAILDLLKVVRLYSHGRPVMLESFAFLNRPNEPIPLFDKAPEE